MLDYSVPFDEWTFLAKGMHMKDISAPICYLFYSETKHTALVFESKWEKFLISTASTVDVNFM